MKVLCGVVILLIVRCGVVNGNGSSWVVVETLRCLLFGLLLHRQLGV